MKRYFSHDYNSRNDPKLIKVMMKHGIAGIGAYWCLIELSYEEDGRLLISECDSYAFALRTDSDLIFSLINDFNLFQKDDTFFWSDSALSRIDKMKEKSKKASESAEKRWNNANAMRSHSDSNAIKGKESIIKENKVNEIKEKKDVAEASPVSENNDPIEVVQPAEEKEKSSAKKEKEIQWDKAAMAAYEQSGCLFKSEKFLQEWIKLCRLAKWRTKPLSALIKSLQAIADYDEDFAVKLVDKSHAGNWQGLVFQDTDIKYEAYKREKEKNELAITTNTGNQTPDQKRAERAKSTEISEAVLTAIANKYSH